MFCQKRPKCAALPGLWLLLFCLMLPVQSQDLSIISAKTVQARQHCALIWYWQDVFSPQEQQKIQQWLCQTYQQVNDLIGPYAAKAEVYLYRRDGASEPVPWAHTDRGGDQQLRLQQLHFYVDPGFSLTQFLADWTAVHEFSHLALPLLDRSDQWFAEGFASYLQVQIQQQQGLVQDPGSYYRQKLQPQLGLLQQDQPLIPLLQQLLRERRYKAAYWGSVLWFIEAESLFAKQGISWFSLIRQYQRQHRFRDQDLAAVIGSFDLLLNAAARPPPLNIKNPAPAKVTQKLAVRSPQPLQQLWLRYQQQSTSQILMQHPLSLIIEKSN